MTEKWDKALEKIAQIDEENLDSVQENVETVLLVEDEVKDDVDEVKVLKVKVNAKKCVKMREMKNIVDQDILDMKLSDATDATRAESTDTDAPIYEKVDAILKLCEKKIDKNSRLEVSRDDASTDKAVVNGEIKLLDDQEQRTAKISSSKDTPAFKRKPQKNLDVRFARKM